MKKTSLLLVTIFLLSACKAEQAMPTPTQIASIDCETIWKQEQTDEVSDLTFSVALEKLQYQVDELIFSILTLKNTGITPLWVNNRMLVNQDFIEEFGELYFVIIAPWNEKATFSAHVNADKSEARYFVLLKPGENAETSSDGVMYYAFTSRTRQQGSIYFPEGKYCIWAVYHNQTNPGLDGPVWKGKIKSNFVEFEIVK